MGGVHLSHAAYRPLQRENHVTVRLEDHLGGEVEVFTQWGAWQGCNRCGELESERELGEL